MKSRKPLFRTILIALTSFFAESGSVLPEKDERPAPGS